MDFEERRYLFGKGIYIRSEGTFFTWVFPTLLLHYASRPFVKVEIT
jgi:hypothetical protein